MPKKKLSTLLVFVQDETGSMLARSQQTVSAFNEYFETLKENAKDYGDLTVHAWQFSESPGEDRVRLLHQGKLSNVPTLTPANYRPRGVTPLLDAVGTAMQQADKEKKDRVLFIVQTDGLENASRDFSREQVAKLVSEKEADPVWTLVFLGEGINNWTQEAAAMGARSGSSMSYAAAAAPMVIRTAAVQTMDYLADDKTAVKNMAKDIEDEVNKKVESKS